MIGLLANKIAGPVLVWLVLGLFASNAVTGFLLKRAWEQNARQVLECDNTALESALAENKLVTDRLREIEVERDMERQARQRAEERADEAIERRIAYMEESHAREIENINLDTASISDDDYWCASEPVSVQLANGLRDRAATYNRTRLNRVDRGNIPTDQP